MNSCQRKFLLFGLMLTNIGSLYAADGFSNSNDPTKAQQPTTAPDMLQQNKEKIAVPEPVTKVDNLIGKKVSLTDIRFTGNTVYSELELKKEVADLLGKANLSSDTETIRLKITRFYIKNGYISSGALIEDTGESDGILKIRIIEGKLIDVHEPPVTNKLASDSLRNESMWPSPIQDGLIWLAELVSQPLPKDYLKERLLDGAGEPFNLNELQDKYRQMLSDPLIKQMTSQVVPGLHPGEAMLNLQQVQRNKPYQLFVGADDYSTPAVGGYTGRMGGWVDNLFRQGERIDGQFAVNGGGNSYNVGISVPVTAQDTRLSFRFSDSATTLVEAPFNKLNLTTHIIGFDGGIAQPVYRTVNDSLVLGANFVVRESRTLQANSC